MWLLLLAFIPCNSSSDEVVRALNASASGRGGGRSCDCMNSLEPWQSDAQGVMGARTTVYYAMGLPKAGTSLMGAALAARLGGGYENEAVYHCCTRCKQKCAACDLSESLSSDAHPTVPHFFMKSIDSYFCQCGHVMVRLRPCIERIAHRGRRVPCRPLHTVLTRLKLMKLRLKTVGVLLRFTATGHHSAFSRQM